MFFEYKYSRPKIWTVKEWLQAKHMPPKILSGSTDLPAYTFMGASLISQYTENNFSNAK